MSNKGANKKENNNIVTSFKPITLVQFTNNATINKHTPTKSIVTSKALTAFRNSPTGTLIA